MIETDIYQQGKVEFPQTPYTKDKEKFGKYMTNCNSDMAENPSTFSPAEYLSLHYTRRENQNQ